MALALAALAAIVLAIVGSHGARSDGAQPDGLANEWVKFSVSVIM